MALGYFSCESRVIDGSREPTYTPTYKSRNWPACNKALRHRGSLTIWFDPTMGWEAAPTGKRGATAIIPPRKTAKLCTSDTAGAVARNKILRRSKRVGRTIWRRWSRYHRRSRAETRLHRVRLLGSACPHATSTSTRRVPDACRPPRAARPSQRSQDRPARGKVRSTSHQICATCVTAPCARGIFRSWFCRVTGCRHVSGL
jgi:hypothetical protein